MPKTPIIPPGSAPPLAPYSPGVRAGDTIYVSGVLPLDAAGALVGPGDVTAQTRTVLDAVRAIVEAGGGTLRDVAMCNIFLARMADYAAMNAVYRAYFAEEPPARWCIEAPLVRPEFLVEISAVAHVAPR